MFYDWHNHKMAFFRHFDVADLSRLWFFGKPHTAEMLRAKLVCFVKAIDHEFEIFVTLLKGRRLAVLFCFNDKILAACVLVDCCLYGKF